MSVGKILMKNGVLE